MRKNVFSFVWANFFLRFYACIFFEPKMLRSVISIALISAAASSTRPYRWIAPEETPDEHISSLLGRTTFLPILPLKRYNSWAPLFISVQVEFPLEDLEPSSGVWLFLNPLGSDDVLWTTAFGPPAIPGIIHLDRSGRRKFRTEFTIGPPSEYKLIDGMMGVNRRSRFVSQYPAFAIDRIGGAIVLGASAIHHVCDGRIVTAALIDSEFWDMHGKLNGREVVLRVGLGSKSASSSLEVPSAVLNEYIASLNRDTSITPRGIDITHGCDDGIVLPELTIELSGSFFTVPMMEYLFFGDDGSCEVRIVESKWEENVFVLGRWFLRSNYAVQFNHHDAVFKICY
jgi:hypothetical protein